HTSRVRDIELATGLEFFSDRAEFDSATALRLRTELPEKLWRL
uniref:Short-chain dehydrogenase n=1 Tax=Steinernema glaseri TaxID=37863 RepID=A0A1I8AEZ0_9BILA